MAADGTITFSTALDNSQLERDLKRAERDVERIRGRLDASKAKRTALEEELDRAQRSMEAASREAEGLKARLEELRNADPTDEAAWEAARTQIVGVAAGIERAEARETELARGKEALEKRWAKINSQVREHEAELSEATTRAGELGERYGEAMRQANSVTARATDGASAAFERLGNRINTMIRRVFLMQVALSALRGLRSMLSDALMQNERLSASVAALRGAFQGVVSYVAGAVAPAITGMVNAAAAAITWLARLIDRLFGTSIVASIASAQRAAQAAWRQTDASKAAAKAAERQAKAARRLRRETDKATKSVLGFDEINALNADDANGAADAMGGQADGMGGGLRPDWDALDVGKIDAKLAEIMLALGAAIMAVGAILAFSGINIPLGIGLMAVGALMMYGAYKEQWDRLPQQVRNSVTGLLVLSGVTLLALGTVLALSGPQGLPVGVGMMVAGAALLWGAVALNWNDMPSHVQGAVATLMMALGVALLAVGAVIAFSGANPPLGIGLMLAGAATLGVASALNWDTLTGLVGSSVAALMLVLGGALLVVGAVLAFSGANPFLGVGLMAAGAVALGGAAALAWDRLPADVRASVGTIAAALSGALLAVGAVLAFSGANLPLGIGLLVVGAVGLAADAALSWDSIPAGVRVAVGAVLAAVGTAFLVLGAVLTFTFANPTLGLGLLALGATSLAMAAALNWDSLPDGVRRVASGILRVVGAAFLVLGAVISFSGAYLPLGIALLALGAASLAASAALNWDALPSRTRGVVSTILGIAGGALLVLGIILCFSGAGMALGLGCIVAGAGSLAAAIAPNWDFLKEKVRQVWDDIVRWWNSDPGRVFTWSFWEGIFKSVVNGLISAINSGLDSFSWFVNGISDMISSTLDFFGVGGYSFSISAGSIPYLAQGAVIPPNREFMAVLGDQTHGNNIETPEALMRQVVREEAGAMIAQALMQLAPMAAGGQGDGRDVVLVVGHTELARATVRGLRDLDATGELGGLGIALA